MRRIELTSAERGGRSRVSQLAHNSRLLRGTLSIRKNTCGKPNCACATGPKHGPFFYLIANLGPGHILKTLLKTPVERETVHAGVAGYQTHWDRLEELSQINLELLRRGEPLKGPER